MSSSDDNVQFASLLQTLAENLILSQLRLDQDYAQSLTEFLALLRTEATASEVLPQFVPAAYTIDNTTLAVAVRLTQTQENEAAIGVKLLHLGYQQKYSYAEFTSSQLQITVQRVPFAPEGR